MSEIAFFVLGFVVGSVWLHWVMHRFTGAFISIRLNRRKGHVRLKKQRELEL